MPEEEFGKRALSRPYFVERLAVQQTVTLQTADRLLRFLGEAPIGPVFRREVEAFLDITGTRATKFGNDAAGYPWFVETLSDGAATRLSAVDRVRAWMVDAAAHSERAVIAQLLKDVGSTTFIHGASTERPDSSGLEYVSWTPPGDRQRPCTLQFRETDLLCACRSADLGVDTA